MADGLVGPHESPHPEDSGTSCAKTDFSVQSTLVAALETCMEIAIAIELIAGSVFVLVFWYRNPELILARRLSQRLLDPCGDEENDDARVHSSFAFKSFRLNGISEL
jgi:hypothetical protein